MTLFEEVRTVFRLRPLQLLALSCLLAGLAAISIVLKTSVLDPDFWWHLKVGDWIVEHGAVPHVGIFSRTAATRPWVAYSWGYEVVVSRVFAWFGLLGFAVFGIVLTLAVACVFFWMLHRLSRNFWVAWLLCVVGAFTFLYSLAPRPVFVSMALFMITFTLVLEAHRTGKVRPLYWLPFIFLLWANVHIQFIYGLFLVGLFAGAHLLQRIAANTRLGGVIQVSPTLPAAKLAGILGACVLACCIGPYSYHLYEVVLTYSASKVPYSFIEELQPLDFRQPTHYLLVLLTAAGFFAVGWRKKLDVFKLSLLIVATVFAFRTARDAWFVAVCATAFLADLAGSESEHQPAFKLPELAGVAAVVGLLLLLVAQNTGFNTRDLDRAISSQYPVDAVNYLRRNPAPGPLYNDLGWGGFLIWYMPNYPVAIDGRNDLYGDQFDKLTLNSVLGDYASDPYLKEAGLVLLPKKAPLSAMLTIDPQFRVVYQDELAVVFVRQRGIAQE